MNYDGTLVKAPPASGRKMMPPTQQQSRQRSTEAMQLQMDVEDQENCSCGMEYGGEHRWTVRDGAGIARVLQYLDENDSMKVKVVESELLLAPEDSEVDLRQRRKKARGLEGSERVCSW